MFEEEKHENVHCSEERCDTKATKTSTICVPVTIAPYAKVGTIVTECCGKPEVSEKHTKCKGVENGSCKFTISQKIKVEIPVEFGANTTVGGTFVECECFDYKDDDHKEEYLEEHHD